MKFGVVIFPGSNCDHDIIYVLKEIIGIEVVELWHKDTDLQNVDCVVLPGGFSYGDYLRSGALAQFSPIMESVIQFANKGGYVLGICNGFQILCEAGLLPGALLPNEKQKFVCKNVFITPDAIKESPNKHLQDDIPLKIPVAHGEGRFYAKNEDLADIRFNHQVLYRYCNENGTISSEFNPNGSAENIASICNENRNVIGIMPHPERASDEELGNTDGLHILLSIIRMVRDKD